MAGNARAAPAIQDHLATARYAMATTDVNRRWQAEMSEFFVADGPPDQSFRRIDEIFHLD